MIRCSCTVIPMTRQAWINSRVMSLASRHGFGSPEQPVSLEIPWQTPALLVACLFHWDSPVIHSDVLNVSENGLQRCRGFIFEFVPIQVSHRHPSCDACKPPPHGRQRGRPSAMTGWGSLYALRQIPLFQRIWGRCGPPLLQGIYLPRRFWPRFEKGRLCPKKTGLLWLSFKRKEKECKRMGLVRK